MSGKNGNRNGIKRKNGQKPKTYSGVVKNPQTKRVTGRVYLKQDNDVDSIKYGTIILIAVLAGIAALVSPLGSAITNQFNYTGTAAADVWWSIIGIAGTVGFVLTIMDKKTKGKY
jgi:hypothetical protein